MEEFYSISLENTWHWLYFIHEDNLNEKMQKKGVVYWANHSFVFSFSLKLFLSKFKKLVKLCGTDTYYMMVTYRIGCWTERRQIKIKSIKHICGKICSSFITTEHTFSCYLHFSIDVGSHYLQYCIMYILNTRQKCLIFQSIVQWTEIIYFHLSETASLMLYNQ